MNIQSSPENQASGTRALPSEWYGGTILASEVILQDPDQVPGTVGWLLRFRIVTAGETAEKWPTINGHYVDGLMDAEGNWQADFAEPTVDNPTRF